MKTRPIKINNDIFLVSDDEIKKEKLRWIIDLRKGMNGFIHQVEVILDSKLCPEIIASTDKQLNLPYLDLSKDKWIIDYYNKEGKLPDEIELETYNYLEKTYIDGIRLDGILTVISKLYQPNEKLYTRDELIAVLKSREKHIQDNFDPSKKLLSINDWINQNL